MIGSTTRRISHICGTLAVALTWGCTQDNPIQGEQGVAPALSNLIAPSVLYNASSQKQVMSVSVSDPQGLADIGSVSYEISKSGSTSLVAHGELADDGHKGDIIPNDGVYAAQIDGGVARGDSGEFNLQVFAADLAGNRSEALTATIMILTGTENLPPEITAVQVPATVAVDSFFNFLVTAEVTDAEGLSDIRTVIYEFFPPAHPNPTIMSQLSDSGEFGDLIAGDGIYSAQLGTDLFAEAADYSLRFQAEDLAGNKSVPRVAFIRGFFIGNRPPVLSNLMAPDTVRIDPNQVTKILITVDVHDPQGLSDIDFVRFRSFLPNGNEAQDSPFELSDDGNATVTGDETAGDGTYSITINLPPTGVQPGDFRFVFQAKDKSDLLSNVIEHIMTVIN